MDSQWGPPMGRPDREAQGQAHPRSGRTSGRSAGRPDVLPDLVGKRRVRLTPYHPSLFIARDTIFSRKWVLKHLLQLNDIDNDSRSVFHPSQKFRAFETGFSGEKSKTQNRAFHGMRFKIHQETKLYMVDLNLKFVFE